VHPDELGWHVLAHGKQENHGSEGVGLQIQWNPRPTPMCVLGKEIWDTCFSCSIVGSLVEEVLRFVTLARDWDSFTINERYTPQVMNKRYFVSRGNYTSKIVQRPTPTFTMKEIRKGKPTMSWLEDSPGYDLFQAFSLSPPAILSYGEHMDMANVWLSSILIYSNGSIQFNPQFNLAFFINNSI